MEPDDMANEFFQGIPNENKVPHIHAISCRKMTILQNPDLLAYCNLSKESLRTAFQPDPNSDTTHLLDLQQELFDSA
jgi:hypothetical protein